MEKPEVVFVQLIAPCDAYKAGLVEEGFFRVEGDAVVLVTAKGAQRYDRKGKAIRQLIAPGETARRVAWRLTKEHMPKRNSGFNRKIHYPNLGKF